MKCLLFCTVLALLPAGVAQAALVLVDVSNPAAVVLTATGEFSLINDNTATTFSGVTFDEFFVADFAIGEGIGGNLTPAGTTTPYDRVVNTTGTVGLRGMNLWSNAAAETQIFSTTMAAFTGQATIDLSGAPLPAPGTVGNIYVGDTLVGSGAVIGQWQVVAVAVPEPASLALMGVACLPLAARRWRKKRARS